MLHSQFWKGVFSHYDFFFFSADDAKEAVKLGVNGILVSNHGARQLDGVPATVSTGANMQQVLSAFGFLFSSSEYMVAGGKKTVDTSVACFNP